MVEIHTRKELYDYLNGVDWNLKKDNSMSSVYFLIEFDGHTEPIYFFKYKDSWFECPCELHKYPLPDNQVKDLVKELYEENSWLSAYEYEINFQKHGYHYQIDNPQCTPFLPDKFNIVDMISESECLIWLMDKYEPKMCANTDMAIYILEFIKRGYAKNYQDAGVTKYLEALQMGIDALVEKSKNKVKAEWVLANLGDNTKYYECSNCFESCVGKENKDTRHISEIFPHCDCCGAEMIKD